VPNELTEQLTTLSTHTIIVCALACEAKPFIDFFKLKKDTNIHAFSVYQLGSVLLIVSGMGENNMSAAVNWLSGYLHHKTARNQFWLNIGVAGHQTADVGRLFCAHKISNYQQTFYPTKWIKHKISLEQLLTANSEETAYKENLLYDMEGAAFFQSATRFNKQESVQCLKIVSDNQHHAVNRDKTFISDLIAKHCQAVVAFIHRHTNELEKHYSNKNAFENFQQHLFKQVHFSHSQQLQLIKLCQSAQSHQITFDELSISNELQAKQILAMLKQHLDTYAVTL
jgi:nucleoside phosphorylase